MSQKNPVSFLQECSIKFGALPVYEFRGSGTTFKCTAHLPSMSTTATGRSKKEAKTLAAEAMLINMGYKSSISMGASSYISSTDTTDQPRTSTNPFDIDFSLPNDLPESSTTLEEDSLRPVSFLQQWLNRNYSISPVYELIDVAHRDTPLQTYYFEVTAMGKAAVGSGRSKNEAKSNAAVSLLSILGVKYDSSTSLQKLNPDISDNPIGKLTEFCQNNLIKQLPSYEVVNETGAAHSKVFVISCTVGKHFVQGNASTKQIGKHLCAKRMLKILEENQAQNLKFESQLQAEDINAKAWKRLGETKVRKVIQLNSTIDKVPLKDYPYLFETNFYGESATLKELKCHLTDIERIPDPENVLKLILRDLQIDYELKQMETKKKLNTRVGMNLLLNCRPRWSFMVVSISKDQAKRELFCSALQFLRSM